MRLFTLVSLLGAVCTPAIAQTQYLRDGDFNSNAWFLSWNTPPSSIGLNPTVEIFPTDGVNANRAFVVHPNPANGYEISQTFQVAGDTVLWASADFANVAQQGLSWYGSLAELRMGVVGQPSQVISSIDHRNGPPTPTPHFRLANKFVVPSGGPHMIQFILRAEAEPGRLPILGQTPLVYFDNASVTGFCEGTSVWRGPRRMGSSSTLDIFASNGVYAMYVSPGALPIPLSLGFNCPLVLDPGHMFVFVSGGIGTGTGLFSQSFQVPVAPLVQARALYWQCFHIALPSQTMSLGQGTMQAFF